MRKDKGRNFHEWNICKVYDEAALEKTMKALEFNPEYATFWNFRREILLHLMASGADRKKLLDKELIFLERALSKVTNISFRPFCANTVWFYMLFFNTPLS